MRRKDHATQMARFCLATGVQPSEYLALTRTQRNAFTAEVNNRR